MHDVRINLGHSMGRDALALLFVQRMVARRYLNVRACAIVSQMNDGMQIERIRIGRQLRRNIAREWPLMPSALDAQQALEHVEVPLAQIDPHSPNKWLLFTLYS